MCKELVVAAAVASTSAVEQVVTSSATRVGVELEDADEVLRTSGSKVELSLTVKGKWFTCKRKWLRRAMTNTQIV